MDKISPALVKTWLFMAKSKEAKFQKSKEHAQNNITKNFGNIIVAELYIEKRRDDEIEVIVV